MTDSSVVLALAKSGDLSGAIAAGEAIISSNVYDASFAMFVGVLCCRAGDVARGVDHLRSASAMAPSELVVKVELARALLSFGNAAEAGDVVTPFATYATPIGREMTRIQAQALLKTDEPAQASVFFQQLVDFDAGDFESWDGLSAGRLALGDVVGAIEASTQATSLQPLAAGYWVNLARAHGAAKHYDAAHAAASAAVKQAPLDVVSRLELSRALASIREPVESLANLDFVLATSPVAPELISEIADIEFLSKAFDRAEGHYRSVVAERPDLQKAWIGLGKLLERMNRTSELISTLDAAAAHGVPASALALLRAQALRGVGQFEEAMVVALAAPDLAETGVARWQLIGKIADRLDQPDVAFSAFSEANRLLADESGALAETARRYREIFERMSALVTPEWYADWSPATPNAAITRRAPLFIFGFPRSGTTLIDTMLSGHPDVVVLEEEPAIDRVAEKLGSIERLPHLSVREIEALRVCYFDQVEQVAPNATGKLIVDKHPLGLGSAPLLYRLFPDARFVFTERHPYDVILSCYMTSSDMDLKLADFYNFEGIALLYDRVLSFWEKCRAVLPMNIYTVRYERLLTDPAAELKTLAGFAGLDWNEAMLDHKASVAERGYIGSPSYAQVSEPLYMRANGRWLKYRQHMHSIDPIIEPWLKKLGYADNDIR